jgi:nickel-dependent lactate racemase
LLDAPDEREVADDMNARCEIVLPHGKQEVTGQLPGANLENIYVPQAVEACSDPIAEVRRALKEPLDTPPLSDIVQPREQVVILVDDHTRTTLAAPC